MAVKRLQTRFRERAVLGKDKKKAEPEKKVEKKGEEDV